jgi:hypothetical protein
MKFAYEAVGHLFNLIRNLRETHSSHRRLLFSSGSFGDHVFHCSLIKSALDTGQLSSTGVIVRDDFKSLYETFRTKDFFPIYISSQHAAAIDNYFMFSSEWLKGNSLVDPILPVYYPLIPYMTVDDQSVTHFSALKSIMRISQSTPLSKPLNYDQLLKIARLNFEKTTNSSLSPIVFAPHMQTQLALPMKFWVNAIFRVSRSFNNPIIVNAPEDSVKGFSFPPNCYLTHFPPELVLPSVDSAHAVISGVSGLANVTKIFTSAKLILVTDYRFGDKYYIGNGSNPVPVDFQYTQYNEDTLRLPDEIRYVNENQDEFYIDRILSLLSN